MLLLFEQEFARHQLKVDAAEAEGQKGFERPPPHDHCCCAELGWWQTTPEGVHARHNGAFCQVGSQSHRLDCFWNNQVPAACASPTGSRMLPPHVLAGEAAFAHHLTRTKGADVARVMRY